MKNILFSFLLLLSASVIAQNKTLSMEDAMLKARSTLAPETIKQLQFIPGGSDYVYENTKTEKNTWMIVNSKSGIEHAWLTLSKLNALLKEKQADTLKALPAIQFRGNGVFSFSSKQKNYYVNYSNAGQPVISERNIEKGYSLLEANKDNSLAAVLKDDNLYVSDFTTSFPVTKDGSKDIVYAQSVHRDEFGINKGTFWSNKGNQLAFYRMDQSMVTDYPIIDWTEKPAKANNIKYPMAGEKSHHVTVGVYNFSTKSLVYLKTGEPAEQYLTNIAWSPDDKHIYIAVLNRGQNHMELKEFDAVSGDFVKTILEEKDEKYLEPLVPMYFLKDKPEQFIWQSNRDGWNHLYLYDISGKLIKQLTLGAWEVIELKHYDAKGQKLYFVATKESPLTRNLYQLNMNSGGIKKVTTGDGVHVTQLSEDMNWLIDSYSNTENPKTIQLTDLSNGKSKVILQAANPLSDYALGALKIFTIKNKSGDDIYARMYTPANFDSTKKYPVIVYWYGGPHAQLILNSWNAGAGDYWFQYMAERGYVVFTIDPRGSDNRGKAFEQAMFRKFGDVQMEDLMSGIDYLKSLSYTDTNRMGLFGWSFGGFATTDFMLRHPGVFKAAVAGGPVMNWQYYEIMYTERYMDTPQENPEGYAATDLTRQVDQLKGKLLLIHGLQDPVVVQQHSVNFVRACIDKNIQVDYMIYPGHEHNVIGKDRAHLYQKVTDYFQEHL